MLFLAACFLQGTNQNNASASRTDRWFASLTKCRLGALQNGYLNSGLRLKRWRFASTARVGGGRPSNHLINAVQTIVGTDSIETVTQSG